MIKYPGKELDQHSFDLINDYWCDLYKKNTPSGKLNGGMLYSKVGTLTAALGFCLFWIATPIHFIHQNIRRVATQILGVSALILSIFLFTSYHDIVISLGSLLGFIALFSLIIALKNYGLKQLYRLGILVILLLIACNLVLIIPPLFFILPVLQKIALIFTMIWAVLVAKQLLIPQDVVQ